MTCPDCRFAMDAFDTECPRCKINGKPVKPSVNSQPITSTVSPAPPIPKPPRCIKCGTQVLPTTKFCPECGDQLLASPNTSSTPPAPTGAPAGTNNLGSTPGAASNALNPALSPMQVVGCLGLFVVLFFLPFSCNLNTPGSSGGGITVSPAGIGSTVVTFDEYNRCMIGMTISECEQIIGAPGTENSRVESAELGLVIVGMQWINPDGSNMQAQFQNGKLNTKAQAGLK